MNIKSKENFDRYFGSILFLFLRPLARLLGFVLKRDHSLKPKNNIAVLKILGGGSLVIAYPSLLGIKQKYPELKFIFIGGPSTKAFAESLKLFDDFIIFDDSSILNLFKSFFRNLKKLISLDTVIDLEVYSKLSNILCLTSLARNRIAFFLENTKANRYINTHSIFFNRFRPIWFFYNRINQLLEAKLVTRAICSQYFIQQNNFKSSIHDFQNILSSELDSQKLHKLFEVNASLISLGCFCSDLSSERMLSDKQWSHILKQKAQDNTQAVFCFLGAKVDHPKAEKIIQSLDPDLQTKCVNLCGKLKLLESVNIIKLSSEFMGIDSSLLHYARLLKIQCTSFWGPTSPNTLLENIHPERDKIYYSNLACSPCVHIASHPPCQGNNLCMKHIFDDLTEAQQSSSIPVYMETKE